MHKKKLLKSFFIILIIVGAVFAFKNPTVKDQLSTIFHLYGGNVLGINTKKADGLTSQLQSDVNQQINNVQKQALNLKISDVLNFFNRTQKVANDFKSMQNYVKDQAGKIHIASKSAESKK